MHFVMTRTLAIVTIVVSLYSVQVTSQIIGDVQEAIRCVRKLLPCHSYIHSEIPPPPSCCTPMKEIAEKDVMCICAVFDHPVLFSIINLTKENALKLLKSCGANDDVSHCSSTNSTSSSPSASPGSTTTGTSSASSSTMKNAALSISLVGFSLAYAYMGI